MIHIWLAIGTTICICMFILYKATEVLSRATFFNHILLSSSSGAKDKKRLELKEDRWMELRDQVCDRFLVIFCGSHCGLSISRNFATDIYNIAMLFFRPDCSSHCSNQESWNSSTSEMYQSTGNKEWYKSTASNKQNSFPRGLIWRRCLLT